ncbi:hypothetical protein GCM10027059_25930 [Myceligenerans halotolerans]
MARERRRPQPLSVALEWIEAHCVVPDRLRAGAPFRLYDYQLRYLAAYYMVRAGAKWVPDDPVLGPAFVNRRGMLVAPQKVGKSPIEAAHCLLEGVGPALFGGWAGADDGYVCAEHGCGCGWEFGYEPGEPMGMPWATPLIQITATSEDQVGNVYDALRSMVELGPLGDLDIRPGEEFTRLPGDGRIDAVTSSAKSRLGQRVTFVVQDEVGIWTRANKMLQVAHTQWRGLAGMGARASMVTNAWDPSGDSAAQKTYEGAEKDVYVQFRQAPKSLAYENKSDRAKIHRFAYEDASRARGGHVDLDGIEAEARDLINAGEIAQAERFFGNRLHPGAGAWLPAGAWEDAYAGAR